MQVTCICKSRGHFGHGLHAGFARRFASDILQGEKYSWRCHEPRENLSRIDAGNGIGFESGDPMRSRAKSAAIPAATRLGGRGCVRPPAHFLLLMTCPH